MIPPDYHDFLDVDGQQVTIRTMQPQDRVIESEFVKGLSPKSRYYRFHGALTELSPQMLDQFTNPDYPDEMALIATIVEHNTEKEIGVARYARTEVSDHAEVAIVIDDEWQGKGIGTRMLRDLRELAKQVGIDYLEVNVLRENRPMVNLAKELGFHESAEKSDISEVVLGKNISPDDK